jgi:NAD(P)-dependent dehydrogenase (short-subunit alcohol dehydrogenase family)
MAEITAAGGEAVALQGDLRHVDDCERVVELAPRQVRVNAIGPGVIEVPRYFDMPGYTTEFGNTLIPWGRVGHPSDIAPAVAFLAGDGAEFITGQTLYVDGGTNARMGLFWETSGT